MKIKGNTYSSVKFPCSNHFVNTMNEKPVDKNDANLLEKNLAILYAKNTEVDMKKSSKNQTPVVPPIRKLKVLIKYKRVPLLSKKSTYGIFP